VSGSSEKLSFECVESIADGRRLPTFREVRALAQELLEQRDARELLSSALDVVETDRMQTRETNDHLRGRERVWRDYLSSETWHMLELLATGRRTQEHVEAGEA